MPWLARGECKPVTKDSYRQPQWHLLRDGVQSGPFSESQLSAMAGQRKLKAHDLLWKPGYETWKSANTIPGLLEPPPPPPKSVSTARSIADPLDHVDTGKEASAGERDVISDLLGRPAVRIAIIAALVLVAALFLTPSNWRQFLLVIFLPSIVIGAIIGFVTYSKARWCKWTAGLAVATALIVFSPFGSGFICVEIGDYISSSVRKPACTLFMFSYNLFFSDVTT